MTFAFIYLNIDDKYINVDYNVIRQDILLSNPVHPTKIATGLELFPKQRETNSMLATYFCQS